MKKRFSVSRAVPLLLVCCLVVCPVAAQPKSAPKTSVPKNGAAQAGYAARVKAICNDLRPGIGEVLATYDAMEDLASKSARRRSATAVAEEQTEWKRLKASLLEQVAKARANARRLRAVSPVPRSLRKADKSLINSSLEMEDGLDTLLTWADKPINENKLRASRQLRKSLNSLDSAWMEIRRRTDPAIQGKVYVDG